jgi:general secretion pathway protein G
MKTPANVLDRKQPGVQRARQDGFTLIELLVVLVILGLLASVAAPQLIKFIGGAKADTAKVQIERLSGVIDLYRLEVGSYPSEQQGLKALVEAPSGVATWNGPYLKKADALVDPWGRPYVYRFPGRHGDYDLYTLGADGRDGGEGENQDVASW